MEASEFYTVRNIFITQIYGTQRKEEDSDDEEE